MLPAETASLQSTSVSDLPTEKPPLRQQGPLEAGSFTGRTERSCPRRQLPPGGAGRVADHTASVNVIEKVLDFVQFGGVTVWVYSL